MMKYLLCAVLALSLSGLPAFAQDTTTSGTQDQTTSGTKKGKKGKKGKKNKGNQADASAAGSTEVAQAGAEGTAVNNTVCPVTGHEVDSMGGATTVTHKGETVKLCCAMCKDKFMADADANLEKAKASAKK